MALHYLFDAPTDVSLLLRELVHDIEARPANFAYGTADPTEGEFDVVIGTLREAADKIEQAVYATSKKT